MLLSYRGVIYAEENPGAVLTTLLSYFPATAPTVMTYRVAVQAVPGWQMLTSAAFMLLTMWALLRFAGRVYSGALLRFGSRVPFASSCVRRLDNERPRGRDVRLLHPARVSATLRGGCVIAPRMT